jgi:hypothetical protein
VCDAPRAFRASGAGFVFPTPPSLAAAFNRLGYDYSTHPITVALHPELELVAASASAPAIGNPWQAFPDDRTPTPVPAELFLGGFKTVHPQQKAWLQLLDENSASVNIELHNLTFSANTASGCTTLVASLNATVPDTQKSVSLTLDQAQHTILELAGDPGKASGWPIAILLNAESVDFDFSDWQP